jgi:hypothetical protein
VKTVTILAMGKVEGEALKYINSFHLTINWRNKINRIMN